MQLLGHRGETDTRGPRYLFASCGFSGYLWPISLPRQSLSRYLCPLSASVSDLRFSSSLSSPSVTLAPLQPSLAFVSLTPISLRFWICISNSASLSLCVSDLCLLLTLSVFLCPCLLSLLISVLCFSSPYLCLSVSACVSVSGSVSLTLCLLLSLPLLALNQPCHHVSMAVHVLVAGRPIFHL